MDEQSVKSSNKMQKLKAEDINNGIRSLDDLPKAILAHIISFLPLKDAVRTSVLSKKWEFLWTSIPNLEFMDTEYSKRESNLSSKNKYSERELYMNFVDRVLLLHDGSPIKKFFIGCNILGSESRLKEWVTAAVRRRVEKCDLRLFGDDVRIPCCLFTCDTLVKLYLDMPCTLRLPSQIHLPNLKSLHLEHVVFSDECSTESLFCSPAIESLYTYDCSWENLSAISISSPKLKRLTIQEDGSEAYYYCRVMIHDCNLEFLHLYSPAFLEYTASNLSAVNVKLSVDGPMDCLIRVLHEVDAVQALTFLGDTLEYFAGTPGLGFDWSYFPVLRALNTLELDGKRVEIGVLGNILQHTPHLRSLVVHEGFQYSGRGEHKKIFDQVPPCFSSSLKKISVGGLCFNEEELHILKVMLKHATALEEFVILPYYDEHDGSLVIKLVRSYGSAKCKISFL